MSKKYSDELIKKYINAQDIEGYDVCDLENDSDFMIEVLDYTKDKKMYCLCSSNVKTDYSFVKYVVENFSSDLNFIEEVSREYLEKTQDDDVTKAELLVLLCEITKETKFHDDFLKYALKLSFLYECFDQICNEPLKELGNKSVNETKNKFNACLSVYGGSKKVTDYFAKRMLKTIFYGKELGLNFEQKLHHICKDKNMIENKINNFIISYVKKRDPYLSDYLACNLNLLDELKKEIKYVLDNWDNYIIKENEDKIDIIYEKIYKFMKDINYLSYYPPVFIHAAAKKLGMQDIFNVIDKQTLKMFPQIKEQKDEVLKSKNFDDVSVLNYTIKIIKDVFNNEIPYRDDEDDYVEDKKRVKIIKFDGKKK